MGISIDTATAFLAEHRGWAFWVALAFALAENTALISIVIPSTAILVAVGALVATGAIDFMPLFLGASLGAVIGSTFSWWLGLTYGERIFTLWPLRNRPDLVKRGTESFTRWGPFAILLGHFVGPLRPVAFLMCGMTAMPFLWFQTFTVVGSVGWAFVIPKMGEVGGTLFGWLWSLLSGS